MFQAGATETVAVLGKKNYQYKTTKGGANLIGAE